jgi:RHS repeat-associated protein
LADSDPDGDGVQFVYNLRFPGQYYDGETGLHYNYFRDYNPGTGRYIESDPIGLKGGLNTYVYTLNNPLDQIDRFGLESCSLLYCFEKQLGFETGLGTGFVAGGAPLINKRFQTRGATGKTSIFSVTFGKMGKMPFRLPAPTYANPRAMTAFFGRFAGRWMPIIGWWMLAYDTYGFTECVLECKDGDCNDK